MYRTLSRVLGGVALAMALAAAGVAEAAPTSARSSSDVSADDDESPSYRMVESAEGEPPPTLGANPRRSIYSEVVYNDGRLYLRGDVADYYGRDVRIQRRGCESCHWRRFDVARTGERGWFSSGIKAPRRGSTFWRAKVRRSDGYAKSFSAVWETSY